MLAVARHLSRSEKGGRERAREDMLGWCLVDVWAGMHSEELINCAWAKQTSAEGRQDTHRLGQAPNILFEKPAGAICAQSSLEPWRRLEGGWEEGWELGNPGSLGGAWEEAWEELGRVPGRRLGGRLRGGLEGGF